jgi:PKD repeat protein
MLTRPRTPARRFAPLIFIVLFSLLLVSCNLTGAPEEQIEVTDVPATNTPLPTRTPVDAGVTPLPIPTQQFVQPTPVVILPPRTQVPTNTPLPVSIFIVSPIPGNVVSGNVQVIGSASHPQFLQYQLEYGPDPNPSNLWFPVTGAVQSPVMNGLLGIWNTTATQDSTYQLRLRVWLRDGTDLRTVVNNIRVQNQAPTPVPTETPTVPRPVAAFTQDRATGNAPLVVRFTNQSGGQIDAHQWNFGDGSTSGELNPTHTFNNPGTYNVTLQVTGPGGTSNVSRQITVQSITAPVAAFTQDRTSGPSPLTVQFTDQSTGEITAREWNFGDGTTSGATNPARTFVDVGSYNVILRVEGPGGSSSVTRQITVENPEIPPPDAAFLPDTPISGEAPLTVQFQNESSGEIDSFNWNFGDGSPTSGDQDPLHTFTQPGTYTTVLTVVGPGGQDQAQVAVEVIQPPDAPTASFEVEGELTGRAPFDLSFRNTSQGEIESNSWRFNDDEFVNDQEVINYSFTEPGTYTVTLTVSGPGGSDTAMETITALPPLVPPEARFEADPVSGPAPLTVRFENFSVGDNLSFLWEFGTGDTSTSSDREVYYEYQQPGSYEARLTATNEEEGLSDTYTMQISVSEEVAQAPQAGINAQPTSGTAPLAVTFASTSQGQIDSWAWDFTGDGVADADGPGPHGFEYQQPGTYTASLTVGNAAGSDMQGIVIVVEEALQPLSADFAASVRQDNPLVVDVQATAQGGTGEYTYEWDFGDGQTAAGATASVTYADGGTYLIRLRVTDGQSEPVEVPREVQVSAPTPPPSVVEETPVLPDLNSIRDQLRQVHQSATTNRNAFALVGDQTAQIDTYLNPFADINPDDPSVAPFRDIIIRYQTPLNNGANSFNRQSVAVGSGLIAEDLISPTPDPACNDGEWLIVCELRLMENPSVVIVNIGYNDVTDGTDAGVFESQISQIIQQATTRGVIPILSTIYPQAGQEQRTLELNEAIIRAADVQNIPVFNQWRAFNELPNSGLDGAGNPTVAPQGAAFIADPTEYGANMRNRYILILLDTLFRDILN